MSLAKQDKFFALRTLVRSRLGVSHAASRDVDAEQAFLRVLIGGGILVYATLVALTSTEIGHALALVMVAASIPLAAGSLMLWWFRRHTERPASMRYVAICADLIPLTVGLWGADEYGVPLIGFYLWVTVGNGFRFGSRMLMFSYWIANLSFWSLLVFGPFWQSHRAIGIGFALILASIPLYVLVLLSRLTAQKDAALELSNAKSRFVANVSHELRTPLTGIYAVHELLRRRTLAPDEKALVASLGQAISALKTSVDAVLQMSKLEAGSERTEPRLFNLVYFLQQIQRQFEPSAVNKTLEWAVHVDAAVPAIAFGDPSHLHHILGNLLNNAFKFTHKGGVTLYVMLSDRGVRFEVVDSGIGIAKDKQLTLFERFVQADSTATRRYGGTGLGTSIAYDLAKLMGGTIGVASDVGTGARFWVELPILNVGAATIQESSVSTRIQVFDRTTDTKLIEESLRALRANYEVVEDIDSSIEDAACVRLVVGLDRAVDAGLAIRFKVAGLPPCLVVDRSPRDLPPSRLMEMGIAGVIADHSPRSLLHGLLAMSNTAAQFSAVDEGARPEASAPCTVLLADDNKSNQVLLARILEGAGHKVISAGRGDDALDVLIEATVDLAILDLNMPEMSGHDVVRLFRAGESGTTRRIPIVILSADATPDAREGSLAAGADEFLTKPVMASDLLAVIDRLMVGVAARRTLPSSSAARSRTSMHPDVRRASEQDRGSLGLGLVDADRIDALRRIANDDRAFLRRYVSASFEDLESALRELRKAVASSDQRGARDALHKIDGTASSLGADALLQSAKLMRVQLLESTVMSGHTDGLAELSSICALTKSALAASLQGADEYR